MKLKIAKNKKKRTMNRSRSLIQQNMIAPIKSTRKSGKCPYFVFLERSFLLILKLLLISKLLLRCTDQAESLETFRNYRDGPIEEERVDIPGYFEEIIIAE